MRNRQNPFSVILSRGNDIWFLITTGLKFRNRVQEILAWLAKKTHDRKTQRSIKNHGIKSAFWLWAFHAINKAANVQIDDSMETMALYMQIVWTNLDKILDYLDKSDSRFFTILYHFIARVLWGEVPPHDALLEHPKFKELDLMAIEIRRMLDTIPWRQDIEKSLWELYQAVLEQRKWEPVHLEDKDYWDLAEVVQKLQNSWLPKEVLPSMYLSIRLWVYTFLSSFAVGLYKDTESNAKKDAIKKYIISYASFIQLYDDYLDRKKDESSWTLTYVTKHPEYLPQYSLFLQAWKKQLENEFASSEYPLPRILITGMNSYSIINNLWPKDTSKKIPYWIPI